MFRGVSHHDCHADLEPGTAAMGYRKLSAQPPRHSQAARAIEDLKETSPRARMKSHSKIGTAAAGSSAAPAPALPAISGRLDEIFGAACRWTAKECGPDHARRQHRGDKPASRRDQPDRCASPLSEVGTCRRVIGVASESPELSPSKTSRLSNRAVFDDLVNRCCNASNSPSILENRVHRAVRWRIGSDQ